MKNKAAKKPAVASDSTTEKKHLALDQINRRAYEIWESHGCPHGYDHSHWLQAEQEARNLKQSA